MENWPSAKKSPGKLKKDIVSDEISKSIQISLSSNRVNQTDSALISNSTAPTNEYRTPNSIRTRNGTFHSFPIVNTPTPPSRFRKIINPFEIGLTDRLHLPLIGSPSLFHRPATPQLCSTQLEFEWTIDEVSSLNPANVEAHETQFISVTDPELEAKAQAAISSYFKEQIIVPSPDECPLRDQKIILSSNFSENQSVRNKRDGYTQTELTLPPILPKAVEDALRPYFTFTQSQQQTPAKDCDSSTNTVNNSSVIDHDARDASLRRKLFQTFANTSNVSSNTEYERDVLLDSPTPQTPEMDLKNIRSRRFLTPQGVVNNQEQIEHQSPLDISLSPVKRESFGCISPISKVPIASPQSNRQCVSEKNLENVSRLSASSLYRSTPDRSTIFRSISSNSINMSIDGTSMHAALMPYSDLKRKSFHLSDDRNVYNFARSSSESNETETNCSYDDEMQISQSSYGSHHHPQTPTLNKSKRRRCSVNRKNLSLSFNSCQNDDNLSVIETTEAMTININENSTSSRIGTEALVNKTDSGFNEMDESKKIHDDLQRQKAILIKQAVQPENSLVNNYLTHERDISMAEDY